LNRINTELIQKSIRNEVNPNC